MRKTNLLILSASLLALTACQGSNPLSSDSGVSDQGSVSENSSAEPALLSQEMLDVLQKGSLSFRGERKTRYTAYVDLVEEGSEEIFIGKASYSFKECSATTEKTITDVSYYKNDEGKAFSYEIDFRNVVSKMPVDGGKLVFDEVFYNPFKSFLLSDFLLGKDGVYSLSETKQNSFWKPLSFYEESVTGIYLTPYADGSIALTLTSEDASSTYETIIEGVLSLAKEEDLAPVSPYASEDYHPLLQSAYDEVVKANNLTYARSRKPVDESVDVDEEIYEAKISKSDPCAVIFSYEGKDDYGIAKYDDGEEYSFAVKEGKAVKGESNSIKLPFTIGTVKMEVFEKVDETHFQARSASIAKTVAGFLMEKLGDALLVDGSAFGDSGCENLVLEMQEGKLTGFEYEVTRSSEAEGSYLEKNIVKIKDVGTTSIPYEFTTGSKKEDPEFDLTPFIGEFEGYNTASTEDNELHTMVIESFDSMSLDGKKLVFKSRVHDQSFNAVWDESRYVQISISSRYGFTIREASGAGSTSFVRGFYWNLAKKTSTVPSYSDLILSNGWYFEDYDENEYKLKLSTTIEDSKFYVQERVDGSWQDVEKPMSEISYNDEDATLEFKANGETFSMKFYSKEQGIVKNTSGTIKAILSPASEY